MSNDAMRCYVPGGSSQRCWRASLRLVMGESVSTTTLWTISDPTNADVEQEKLELAGSVGAFQ